MNADAARLLEEALRLPEEERADLAARLIESLDPQVDPDAGPAWEDEVGRRVRELDDGSVRPVPWSEARRRIAGAPDDSADR